MAEYVIIFLLAFIVVRELVFLRTLDKLTNKIMSKNYYDYSLSSEMSAEAMTPQIKVKEMDYSEADDLRALNGIV